MELIVDFGKQQEGNYTPLKIDGTRVGRWTTSGTVWSPILIMFLSLLTAAESQDVPTDTQNILHLYCGEYIVSEHHCLVWQQHPVGP